MSRWNTTTHYTRILYCLSLPKGDTDLRLCGRVRVVFLSTSRLYDRYPKNFGSVHQAHACRAFGNDDYHYLYLRKHFFFLLFEGIGVKI